jgi:hypothetical protein
VATTLCDRLELAPAATKFDGRADDHFSAALAEAFVHRLDFDTGENFTRSPTVTVYRKVQLFFELRRTKCIIIDPCCLRRSPTQTIAAIAMKRPIVGGGHDPTIR